MTVQVNFAGPIIASAPDRYEQALARFLACASRGAFCRPSTLPRGWIDAQPIAVQRAGRRLVLSAPTGYFDDRALQVLRNLLLAAADADDEGDPADDRIVSIVVSMPDDLNGKHGDGRLPMLAHEDNEDDEYPQVSQNLGFEFQQEEVDDTWVRRCILEWAEPVRPELVQDIEAWISPWFVLLEAGGYSLPVGLPSDLCCVAGGVVQFDEFSVEVSVMRFHACEMAWNALLNMLAARSDSSPHILRVVME